MTTTIVLYFAFGACFGLATFSHRHLFSEGPSRKEAGGDAADTLVQRLIWVLTSCALWPILALTGAYSLWRRARARDSSNECRKTGP